MQRIKSLCRTEATFGSANNDLTETERHSHCSERRCNAKACAGTSFPVIHGVLLANIFE
jgi:hypothetical protein